MIINKNIYDLVDNFIINMIGFNFMYFELFS